MNSPREGPSLKIQCPYLEIKDFKSEKRNRVIGKLKRKKRLSRKPFKEKPEEDERWERQVCRKVRSKG